MARHSKSGFGQTIQWEGLNDMVKQNPGFGHMLGDHFGRWRTCARMWGRVGDNIYWGLYIALLSKIMDV